MTKRIAAAESMKQEAVKLVRELAIVHDDAAPALKEICGPQAEQTARMQAYVLRYAAAQLTLLL